MKQDLTKLQEEKAERESSFIELKNERDNLLEENEKEVEEMKQSITKTFQNTLQHLNSQFENQKKDFIQLSTELAESTSKSNSLENSLIQAQNEKKKLQLELQKVKKQSEKEKHLNEVQLQTQILSLKNKYQKEFYELKSQQERQLNDIINYGVETFKQYFSPSDQINLQTYKNVLEKVTEDLRNLNKTNTAIRTMLHATEKQTTEDAVAKLLIGEHIN